MASFTEIPILDLSLARSAATKPGLLDDLRRALLEVGFMYICHTGIEQVLFDRVSEEGIRFFEALPEGEKLAIEMKNQPSFLGYSRVSLGLSRLVIVGVLLRRHTATRSCRRGGSY